MAQPGVNLLTVGEPVYGPAERAVLDTVPAEAFFAAPRIGVAHADAAYGRALADLYRRVLAPLSGPTACLLDLCGSWTCHLPPGVAFGKVVGHGVNGAELAANAALTSAFLADLNARPALPLPPAAVAAVTCASGLPYLTLPEFVFAEVARVLLPGGLLVLSFSDYCWPERAAAGWLARDGRARLELAERLCAGAGLDVVSAEAVAAGGGGDTLYAVVARRPDDPGPAPLDAALAPSPALQELDAWARQARPASPLAPPPPPPPAAASPAPSTSAPVAAAPATPAPAVPLVALERWREAYGALVADAVALGIPRAALPALPADAGPAEVAAAREHAAAVVASFMSAGL